MKKNYLKLLFVFITVLLSLVAMAQIVEFEYDDAGNRIMRDVIYFKSTIADSSDHKQTEEFQVILGETQVTISPNPNGGTFTVKIENNLQSSVDSPHLFLYTINGVLIYENNNAGILNEIDISEHKNGTYILSLIIGPERKTWKIIKQ